MYMQNDPSITSISYINSTHTRTHTQRAAAAAAAVAVVDGDTSYYIRNGRSGIL